MPRKARFYEATSTLTGNRSFFDSTVSDFIDETEHLLRFHPRASTPCDASNDFIGNDSRTCSLDAGFEQSLASEASNNLFNDSNRSAVERIPLWSVGGFSCSLTQDELVIILLSIQARYRLPDSAMDTFCGLLRALLPPGYVAPTSFRQVMKIASEEFSDFCGQTSYVCSGRNCLMRLQKSFDVCSRQECHFYNRMHQTTSFVAFNVRPQIELIVTKYICEIQREIDKAEASAVASSVSDILSSAGYLSRRSAWHLADSNNTDGVLRVTLMLSSDGAQPFRCGGFSLWPCVAVLCELPPKVRVKSENCIVFGFWVGNRYKKKPVWPVFLESAIVELNVIRNGFDVTIGSSVIRVKVEIFATIMDLPAQASMWSHKQFNGKLPVILDLPRTTSLIRHVY